MLVARVISGRVFHSIVGVRFGREIEKNEAAENFCATRPGEKASGSTNLFNKNGGLCSDVRFAEMITINPSKSW